MWRDWWTVGCGVESLHAVLTGYGVVVDLDDVLREALARDGYDDDLGWRHHALVAVAAQQGVRGEVVGDLTADALAQHDGWWLVSVRAPEQFASTHLVAVHRLDSMDSPGRACAGHDAVGIPGAGGAVGGASSARVDEPVNAAPLEVTWPQGHLEHGRVFVTTGAWLARRMTGRGMRFTR